MERSILRMESVTPYGPPFIFCTRENLARWKGARFGYQAHFNPRIDEYWIEMGSIERQEYFFTFSGFEEDRTIPPGFFWYVPHQLEEYYCAFSKTEWGIWHNKPMIKDNKMLLLEPFHEVKLSLSIEISEKGAVMFPAWMSGVDLEEYDFGIYKYTDKQEHFDLLVLDVTPGIYSVFVVFPFGKNENNDALGFIMRKNAD